jgi:drug/metabolite transporter (DMT)-like permease
MLGVILIWGVNLPVTKFTLDEMGPLAFNGLRFIGSSALNLLLVWIIYKDLRVARRDWGRILFIGLVGVALHQILFIKGLQLSRAGNSSLILATVPLFVALFSALGGQELITTRLWAGILFSFAGIALVTVSSGSALGLASSTLGGDLLTLLAAITWAAYAVLSRPLLARYPPVKLTALTMAVGTPFLVLAGIPEMLHQDWSAVTWRGWGGFVFSFVLSLSLASIVYYYAIQVVGNARASVYQNLVPVVALASSALLIKERIAPLQLAGAVVILLGIYLARSGKASPDQRALKLAASKGGAGDEPE